MNHHDSTMRWRSVETTSRLHTAGWTIPRTTLDISWNVSVWSSPHTMESPTGHEEAVLNVDAYSSEDILQFLVDEKCALGKRCFQNGDYHPALDYFREAQHLRLESVDNIGDWIDKCMTNLGLKTSDDDVQCRSPSTSPSSTTVSEDSAFSEENDHKVFWALDQDRRESSSTPTTTPTSITTPTGKTTTTNSGDKNSRTRGYCSVRRRPRHEEYRHKSRNGNRHQSKSVWNVWADQRLYRQPSQQRLEHRVNYEDRLIPVWNYPQQ